KGSQRGNEIENEIENDTFTFRQNQEDASLSNHKKENGKNDLTEYPEITDENVVSFLTEYGEKNPETQVLISTRFGEIEIELFKDTPLHRANFVYLVKQHYFDETFFHRVVPNFSIQAGNSD